MVTLEKLLVELSGVLPADVVAAPAGLDGEITGLSIHDPFAQDPELDGELLLGIGLSTAEAVAAVERLGSAGASALLLKADDDADLGTLAGAGERAGVAVLAIPLQLAWTQVQSLVMAALAGLTTADVPADPDDRDADDLFAIADTAADLVDGPILIQDRHMHVLAFSGRQEEADAVRTEVILQRGMPPSYARRVEELKILQRVFREREPVYFEPLEGMEKGRVASAVRAGDEVLGTITAALRGPPSDEQRRMLTEAAKLAALSMLRQRALDDSAHRHAADLVATLLEGGVAGAEAAGQLGFDTTSFRVLAAGVRSVEDLDTVALQRRLVGALRSHLSLFRVAAATALLGNVVYVVVPASDPDRDRQRLLRQVTMFTSRGAGHLSSYTLIGIGGHATRLADVPRSRQEADDVLRVLRSDPGETAVAEIDDVRLRVWLQRLRDVLGDESALSHGALGALIEHDAVQGTDYLATLQAHLERMGDTARIAEDLCIHMNTVRYRMRKLKEFGLDLDDPDRRLELHLRLRMLAGSWGPGG